MSVQTGSASVIPAPPSARAGERLSNYWARLRSNPNPVWVRELRQSVRLQRTPIILSVLTAMMTLLICSVGGIASVSAEPAKVGSALFHTFFSLAFAVVTWAGPAVAASTIASERSGRTWEALVLTGLREREIARGKLFAAMTHISLYVAALSPVGTLPFLFGGVTATEVCLAFLILIATALLSVAFGLAVSSKYASPATALIVTLIVAIPASTLAYILLGPVLSIGIHELWAAVPAGPPVWLPSALVRADFGPGYLLYLIAAPLLAFAIPSWLFQTVTCANLQSPNDDRSFPLRVWFFSSTAALFVLLAAAGLLADTGIAFLVAIAVLALFLLFSCFLFASEPLEPSKRVRTHWDRRGAGRIRRALGPGIIPATVQLTLTGLLGLSGLTAIGIGVSLARGDALDAQKVGVFGSYFAAFFVFVAGFVAWARARSDSGVLPRLSLLGILFATGIGPWIVLAILGALRSAGSDILFVAAPSPSFPVVVVSELGSGGANEERLLSATAAASLFWAVAGLGLSWSAARRVRKVMSELKRAWEPIDAALEAEDQLSNAPTRHEAVARETASERAPGLAPDEP